MLTKEEISSYGKLLVICPHCGANGVFKTISKGGFDTVYTCCQGCGHKSADFYPTKENCVRLTKEWAEGSPVPRMDLPTDTVIVCNYGGGVDSTAMLIEMVDQGIIPDLILMADPGDEKLETYAYMRYFNEWLLDQGFPGITMVSYNPVSAPYTTLYGNCIANETLPAISFRKKNCTLKFKAAVMDAFLLGISRGPNKKEGWVPGLEALRSGKKIVKTIGYDFGPIDSCRAINITEDAHFQYLYPLRQLKWSREDCITRIARAGLQIPIKSACYYCCSSKPWELYWMGACHPDLLINSLIMEDTARNGKHGLRAVNGLWGQGKPGWRQWCEEEKIIAPGTYDIIATTEWLLEKVRELKPPLESNLDFHLPLDASHPESLKIAA